MTQLQEMMNKGEELKWKKETKEKEYRRNNPKEEDLNELAESDNGLKGIKLAYFIVGVFVGLILINVLKEILSLFFEILSWIF